MPKKKQTNFKTYHETSLGKIVLGDSLDVLSTYKDESVNLIMTSPPFGLVRKKDYGNVEANEYVNWFKAFAAEFHRVLKDNGSLVIDIGGAWNKGYPTRSLYHFKLLIMAVRGIRFSLGARFLLVESVEASDPCRVGYGTSPAGQRRNKYRLVALQKRHGPKPATGASSNPIARVCRSSLVKATKPRSALLVMTSAKNSA